MVWELQVQVVREVQVVHWLSQVTEVKMSVQYMSFSAHADAKGIMQLISWCEPRWATDIRDEKKKNIKDK